MKRLKDIAYIQGEHFIIDCCQDSQSEDQYNTLRTIPIINHTFYLNIAILTATLLEDKKYKIRCKKCQTEYKITEDILYNTIDKANRDNKK